MVSFSKHAVWVVWALATMSSSTASAFLTRQVATAAPVHPVLSASKTISTSFSSSPVNISVRGGALFSTAVASDKETSTTTSTKCPSLSEQSPAYEKLVSHLQSITQLQRAQAVLNYDQLVFMPEQSSAERGAQLAALASVIHEKSTAPEILEWIEEAEKALAKLIQEHGAEDYKDESRILQLEKKNYLQNERVPAELAGKAAALSSTAYAKWVAARQASDFSKFSSTLQDCFETAKDIAKAKRGDADHSLYTQMLDEFEVGMSQARIDEIFAEIKDVLVPFIEQVLSSESPPSTKPLQGKFDVESQKELSQKIVTQLGFNEDKGRIDVSVHPFTTSFSPSDVRITSRFREDEWYQGLAGSVHEGGHAIYEQNLRSSALSIDTALSMGTHESQSLFWERHVGLSKPFWNWATPMLKETFGDYEYSAEEIYGAVNGVSQSLIRVEADELTYPLHVILRYSIEKDMVEGTLDVADLPARWNKDMKDLLGAEVPSDDVGCLQDVHWSGLAIGYFPTYLIGAATSAQLEHYCRKDISDFDSKIENGEFSEIRKWLTDKIHSHGKRYESLDDLLRDQIGEELNPKYFLDYLRGKYSDLYKL